MLIKAVLLARWGVEDEVDLERALEQVLLEYQHIDNRWDVRLQALFAANDQVQVALCTCKSALLKFRHAQDKGRTNTTSIRGVVSVGSIFNIYISCTRTHMHTFT